MKKQSAISYLSPEIEMTLVQIEGVIASSGTNESYDEGSTDGWYDDDSTDE